MPLLVAGDGRAIIDLAGAGLLDPARFGGGDPNHVRDELRLCAQTARETSTEALVRAVIDTGAYDDRTLRLLARAVVAAGYGLAAWTVNDPDVTRRLFGWGVSAVFTDRLDLIGPEFA